MKIILFTHKADIDGMGEVILSKIAFGNINYILCNNVSDLEKKFIDEYNKGELYKYDFVYITDLSLKKDVLETVCNDEKLKNKLYIFDHHETAKELGLDMYPNCTVKISNELGTMCATQIYYEYLCKNNYIKPNKIIDEFVEMVRREDTFEWKKLNDTFSHDLAILFSVYGPEKYITTQTKKLIENIDKSFFYTDDEKEIIEEKKKTIVERIKSFLNYFKKISIDNVLVGVCFIDYEYRNEVGDYVKEHIEEFDVDVIAMIAIDNNQISLRTVRGNGYARIIAQKYGGGGHDNASAIPITEDKKDKIVELLLKND